MRSRGKITPIEYAFLGLLVFLFLGGGIYFCVASNQHENTMQELAQCLADTDRKSWNGACPLENVSVYANDDEAFVEINKIVYEAKIMSDGRVLIMRNGVIKAMAKKRAEN